MYSVAVGLLLAILLDTRCPVVVSFRHRHDGLRSRRQRRCYHPQYQSTDERHDAQSVDGRESNRTEHTDNDELSELRPVECKQLDRTGLGGSSGEDPPRRIAVSGYADSRTDQR